MKLKKLILENFRGYKGKYEIDIKDNISVFIGQNDVGKSTILEALDIFFNEKDANIKIEKNDLNIENESNEIIIGVVLSEFPEKIIVDSSVETSLAEEFLLNSDNLLEIHKIYSAGKLKQTLLKANHPVNPELKDILITKSTDLKKIVKENSLEVEDKRKSSLLRKAIRKNISNIQLSEINIPIDQDGAKQIWDQIKKYLPLFALFQSDRTNRDQDGEIQDPLKFAIKEILKKDDLQKKLEEIAEEVDKISKEIIDNTIDKVREMNPEIAEKLKAVIPSPKWESVFKGISISDEKGIPLNKRGSGVRRLILLNFFRAEADRKRNIRNIPDVIYAIEEPETSQHPNFQKKLIEAFIELSNNNKVQILFTTHSPGIAQILPINSIFLVSKENDKILINSDNEEVLLEVSKNLGVLPTLSKVVICVEGENDIKFIANINKNIPEINEIIDLEKEEITIIPLQGSNLINWVKRHYLKNSNVIEFHIYDSDIGSSNENQYKSIVDKVNQRDDKSRAVLTKKREIENYIHSSLISDEFNINLDNITNWDKENISLFVLNKTSFDDEKIIKEILNGKVSKKIRKNHLDELNSFDEISGWFKTIKDLMSS